MVVEIWPTLARLLCWCVVRSSTNERIPKQTSRQKHLFSVQFVLLNDLPYFPFTTHRSSADTFISLFLVSAQMDVTNHHSSSSVLYVFLSLNRTCMNWTGAFFHSSFLGEPSFSSSLCPISSILFPLCALSCCREMDVVVRNIDLSFNPRAYPCRFFLFQVVLFPCRRLCPVFSFLSCCPAALALTPSLSFLSFGWFVWVGFGFCSFLSQRRREEFIDMKRRWKTERSKK